MFFKKVKSFDAIMGSFVKAKADLGDYIIDVEDKQDKALIEAQRQAEIANHCTDELNKAENAITAMNRLLGE